MADYLGVLISDLREENEHGGPLRRAAHDPRLQMLMEKLAAMDDTKLRMTEKFVASILDEE